MYNASQPETIRALFGSIAQGYDKANTLISLGLHKRWNRRLIQAALAHHPQTLLDLCAGTGEIALGALKQHPTLYAHLLDFCPEMLEVAKHKGAPLTSRFTSHIADAQEIPLPSSSIDAITVAYGIRNVQNTPLAFREAFRVLKPGGTFSILELTRPSLPLLHASHSLYLSLLLPLLGKWMTSNPYAYRYLARSISTFINPTDLKATLHKTGFSTTTLHPLSFGIATLIIAHKR